MRASGRNFFFFTFFLHLRPYVSECTSLPVSWVKVTGSLGIASLSAAPPRLFAGTRGTAVK